MTYFDNAATTYPKPDCVYSYMDQFYRQNGASIGRGNSAFSQNALTLMSDTRKKLSELLHCPNKQVIFTPSATIALNMILQGILVDKVKHVYISPFEHNAVTRVLHHFELQNQIEIHHLNVSSDMVYNIEKIRYQFDDIQPDLVVVSHASNVFGIIAPVEEIFSLAKKYEAMTVLDMAQTAGLVDCDIGSSTFDFAVFAGHKTLYGPTGISGFVMKAETELKPILFGGTGFESANQNMPDRVPERYEMGTINTVGLAGLNAALTWIEEQTISKLFEHEQKNRQKLVELLMQYDCIKIIGNDSDAKYVGIVSCLIDGISSDSAETLFGRSNIVIRTGLQCAPLAHRFMGTFPAGTIRLSTSYFTTDNDFEQLREALDYIQENI